MVIVAVEDAVALAEAQEALVEGVAELVADAVSDIELDRVDVIVFERVSATTVTDTVTEVETVWDTVALADIVLVAETVGEVVADDEEESVHV